MRNRESRNSEFSDHWKVQSSSGWNPGSGRVHQVKLASVLEDLSWSPYCAANELCELRQARQSCVSLHRILIFKARLCSQSLDYF